MSTNTRNWGRKNMYIGFHRRGARPGQSRRRLLTRYWPLNLVHVRVKYTIACGRRGRHHGTPSIEEQSGSNDRDCCDATDDATSDGPRA